MNIESHSEAHQQRFSALMINAGSSSLRLASYVLESPPRCVANLQLTPPPTRDAAVLVEFVRRHARSAPDLVMHRVVHGGHRLNKPCLIDQEVEAEIERLKGWAPLHNGVALDWICATREAFGPDMPQGACFDTDYYTELPDAAAGYAVPSELRGAHEIRRYGFHGLAHQSMLIRWREQRSADVDQRVISLQLGAGCSITATNNGRPIETSMGFSPLEGLMMATRCGDLDPAVILYLIGQCGFSAVELDWILNKSSGLRGVSGESGDMRSLLASETEGARLAVDMFCHRARKYLGAYLAVLGSADAILFGGGIGENAPVIRARLLDSLDWAGIRLDAERNKLVDASLGGPIHADASEVELWVTPTDEERVMAEAARTLLGVDTPHASEPSEISR